jgi:serine protease
MYLERRWPSDRPVIDPPPPPSHVLAPVEGRVLDPSTSLVVGDVRPRPTVYASSNLLVGGGRDPEEVVRLLRPIAKKFGWDVAVDTKYRNQARKVRVATADDDASARYLGVSRITLTVLENVASVAPDAWSLLQEARATCTPDEMRAVGLDHLLFASTWLTPMSFTHSHIEPLSFTHSHAEPLSFTHSHETGDEFGPAISSYAIPGSGGRQPIAFAGPPPHRRRENGKRRPVVAILDTGCGAHPWLDRAVKRHVKLDEKTIGYANPETDPEKYPDQTGPLDGSIDPLAGHGTFIAGLVHQACPDADIVSWRAVPSKGPIVETDWIKTLSQVVELVQRHAVDNDKGLAIDVLSLSLGYYHETPDDLKTDSMFRELLDVLARCGTIVVCSAGNDATARKSYPAAFAPKAKRGKVTAPRDRAPIISVGALNPDGSVALFSNTGPWVRAYELGAAVVSTMPPFQGGMEPLARTNAFGLPRASIDPDDFSRPDPRRRNKRVGGFALWSGTSFAAPTMAGRIAEAMLPDMPNKGDDEKPEEAVARAWKALNSKALAKTVGITPS